MQGKGRYSVFIDSDPPISTGGSMWSKNHEWYFGQEKLSWNERNAGKSRYVAY